MMLWLYSVDPPFYFHLNKACRERDQILLPMLGPFAKAMSMVLSGTAERNRNDAIERGYIQHNPTSFFKKSHPLGFLNQSFLVFRGVSLTPDVIKKWTAMQGKRRYTDQ